MQGITRIKQGIKELAAKVSTPDCRPRIKYRISFNRIIKVSTADCRLWIK